MRFSKLLSTILATTMLLSCVQTQVIADTISIEKLNETTELNAITEVDETDGLIEIDEVSAIAGLTETDDENAVDEENEIEQIELIEETKAASFDVMFNGVKKDFSTMADVAAAMKAGDKATIKLNSDTKFEGNQVKLLGGDLTLDLNGKTLTIDKELIDPKTENIMPYFCISGKDSIFTITDSSLDGKGQINEGIDLPTDKIYMYITNYVVSVLEGAKAVHNGGTINCTAAFFVRDSSIEESSIINAKMVGIQASGTYNEDRDPVMISANAIIKDAKITVKRDKHYNETGVVDVDGYTNTEIDNSELYIDNAIIVSKPATGPYKDNTVVYVVYAPGVFDKKGVPDTRNTKFVMKNTTVTAKGYDFAGAYAVHNYNNASTNVIDNCKLNAYSEKSNTIGLQINPSVHAQYSITHTDINVSTKDGYFTGINVCEDYNIDDANIEFSGVNVVAKMTGVNDYTLAGNGIEGIGHYKNCDVTAYSASGDVCAYHATDIGAISDYADGLLGKTSFENVSFKAVNTDKKGNKFGNKGNAYGALIYGVDKVKNDLIIKNGTSFYAKGNGESAAVKYKPYSYDNSWTGKERVKLADGCYFVDSNNNKISEPGDKKYVLVTDGSKKADEPNVPDMPEDPEDPEAPEDPLVDGYRINYVLRDNANTPASNHVKNVKSYTGKAKIKLYAPTREGYTFLGWFDKNPDDADFNSRVNKKVSYIKRGATGDKIFYANWRENKYKLAYNANGGKFVERMLRTTHDYTEEYETLSSNILKERKGYTFVAWNTKKRGGVETRVEPCSIVTKLSPKNNKVVTLFAEWSINQYPVTYVLNGGTQAVDRNGKQINPETHTYIKAVKLKAPKRDGYRFGGWYREYDEETDTYSKKVSSIPKKTEDITLYAKWIEVNKN